MQPRPIGNLFAEQQAKDDSEQNLAGGPEDLPYADPSPLELQNALLDLRRLKVLSRP